MLTRLAILGVKFLRSIKKSAMDRKKLMEENGKVVNIGKSEFIKIFSIDKDYKKELYANKIG